MHKSPVRKLAVFFEKSRDGWKAKCQTAKSKAKYWSNQARAVSKSRDQWRQKAEAAAEELTTLKQQLAELQKTAAA